jgi:hypothetical protein
MSTTAQTIDEAKLEEFMGRFVGDLGAAMSAALVVIGDRLGLYRALAGSDRLTADELAQQTGTDSRYVRNGSQTRRPAATSATTRTRRRSSSRRNSRSPSLRRTARRSFLVRSRWRRR